MVDGHNTFGAYPVQPKVIALTGGHPTELEYYVGPVVVGPRGSEQVIAGCYYRSIGYVWSSAKARHRVGQYGPTCSTGQLSERHSTGR